MKIPYTLNNFRGMESNTLDEIKSIQFSPEDVLTEGEDKRVRNTNLEKAIALGKGGNHATFIILKNGDQFYKIETNIIALNEGFVYTKIGLQIPIPCIYSVDFISI